MIYLLLLVALAAPPNTPRPWVSRDVETLRLTVNYVSLVDDYVRARATRGLESRLRITVQLVEHDTNKIRGLTWRFARVRYDIWDDILTGEIESPDGSEAIKVESIDDFLEPFLMFKGVPIARNVSNSEINYRVDTIIEINPLTDEGLATLRQWVALPDAGSTFDPLGGNMLGSFVRIFANLKHGPAEKVIRHSGQVFRADRLRPYQKAP